MGINFPSVNPATGFSPEGYCGGLMKAERESGISVHISVFHPPFEPRLHQYFTWQSWLFLTRIKVINVLLWESTLNNTLEMYRTSNTYQCFFFLDSKNSTGSDAKSPRSLSSEACLLFLMLNSNSGFALKILYTPPNEWLYWRRYTADGWHLATSQIPLMYWTSGRCRRVTWVEKNRVFELRSPWQV